MKIDFLGAYKDLSRTLNQTGVGRTRSENAPAFSQLLESVSPSREGINSISSHGYGGAAGKGAATQIEDGPGAMARYSFSEPKQIEPQLERIIPSSFQTPVVNESPTGVKTPTVPEILKAERVSTKAVAPDREATIKEVKSLVQSAAKKHGVDPLLSMAVINAESSFNPNAVSKDGHYSKGLFQLLDSTGKQLLERSETVAPYDPFNPVMNVDLGVSYLRRLHDLFSQPTTLTNNSVTRPAANYSTLEKIAVAAFNAGEGRVASAQERAEKAGLDPTIYEQIERYLPDSTQDYVKRIVVAKDDYDEENWG